MTVLSTRVSLVPAALAYVKAMCEAAGGDLAGVSVLYGPVADEQLAHEMLVFGDTPQLEQSLAHFGVAGLKRDEVSHTVMTVFVAAENTDTADIVQRAFDIASRVDALVQADYTLGGLCEAASVQPFELRKFFTGTPGGREVYLRTHLVVQGRVS